MQDSNAPVKIPAVWANAAISPNIRPIPIPSQILIQNGAASFTDGFPPNTFLALAAGGAGPWGADFNGLLLQITGGVQWFQAGGPIYYDSAFQTQIGGYPKNAIVASTVVDGTYWRSTVENNVTNPDTGGAGWVTAPLAKGSLIGVQRFTTPGTFTYTPTPGTFAIDVTVVGGGGGSGGSPGTASNQVAVGVSGGAGGYATKRIVSGFSGAAVVVGAGGTAGNAVTNGGNGGTSSFGAVVTCAGASGGIHGIVSISIGNTAATAGGIAVGGDLNVNGGASAPSLTFPPGAATAGLAGSNPVSASPLPFAISTDGVPGTGYGGGATAGVSLSSNGTGQNGAAGSNGAVLVYEYR